MAYNSPKNLLSYTTAVVCGLVLFLLVSSQAQAAASLRVSPTTGTFIVGETFSISLYLDTGGQFVNAVQAELLFPPEKIQVVSPSTGRSFIDVWVGQPSYSNNEGTLSFRGAIPNPGINTSDGLISTITFRVKAPGTASVKFTDNSKVLLNDGQGTDVLGQTTNGIYTLTLPPPAGPVVVSATHPDQSRWYNSSNLILKWTNEFPAVAYSYVLDKEPISVPDDTPEPNKEGVSYQSLSDGTYYFHVKAYNGRAWGQTSHFAVNIDTTPPAKFDVKISPSYITSHREPVLGFATTDSLSGISHYELKVVSLSKPVSESNANPDRQEFFIEAASPYVPQLEIGNYAVIVRAYDNAGNLQEVSKEMRIVSNVLLGFITASWFWLIIILIMASLAAWLIWWRIKRWRHHIEEYHQSGVLSHDEIQKKMEELQTYRAKYGHLVLLLGAGLLAWGAAFSPALALDREIPLAPPVMTTVSQHISNQEIFYVGGKVTPPNADVLIYFQNLETGETMSHLIKSDRKGDWFFTHDSFLTAGHYLVWSQSRVGEVISPPSPQENVTVSKTAIQLGASRLSYETLYIFVSLMLLLVTIWLSVVSWMHYRSGQRRKVALLKELREAEESIKRGFAVLKRDIEKELKTAQERGHREELLRDLEVVESKIGKEVWDIEHVA